MADGGEKTALRLKRVLRHFFCCLQFGSALLQFSVLPIQFHRAAELERLGNERHQKEGCDKRNAGGPQIDSRLDPVCRLIKSPYLHQVSQSARKNKCGKQAEHVRIGKIFSFSDKMSQRRRNKKISQGNA